MGSAAFKAVVGREERPGCVRFARISANMTGETITFFSATDVSASFVADDGSIFTPLDGVSLTLKQGDIVDIVGESGSGKSTMLLAFAQMLPGATATLSLKGQAASEFSSQSWRTQVALLPQKPQLIGEAVEDAFLLPWTLKVFGGKEKPSEKKMRVLLDEAGLEDVALSRPCEKLSVGQAARVAFVRSLLIAPCILLLDEADAALDKESSSRITKLTEKFVNDGEGCAVLRVRHREDDGLATRRYRLAGGKLVEEALERGEGHA